MKLKIIFVFLASLPLLCSAEQRKLSIPPLWDEENESYSQPDFITVMKADSIDSCQFHGGTVSVLNKEKDGLRYIQTKECGMIMMSPEKIVACNPDTVEKQKREFKMRQEFLLQQRHDLFQTILDHADNSCAYTSKELNIGKVYRVTGRIYRYGPDTSASNMNGQYCQIELESLVDIIAFDKSGEFALASYHAPQNSTGSLTAGPKNAKAASCKDQEKVILPVLKLKNHFQFVAATTLENMQARGIVASLSNGLKNCDPEYSNTNKDMVQYSKAPKTPNRGAEPAQANELKGKNQVAQ